MTQAEASERMQDLFSAAAGIFGRGVQMTVVIRTEGNTSVLASSLDLEFAKKYIEERMSVRPAATLRRN